MLAAISNVFKKMSKGSTMSLFDLFDNSDQSDFQAFTKIASPGKWVRNVKTSSFFAETEHTTFSTVGIAKQKMAEKLILMLNWKCQEPLNHK